MRNHPLIIVATLLACLVLAACDKDNSNRNSATQTSVGGITIPVTAIYDGERDGGGQIGTGDGTLTDSYRELFGRVTLAYRFSPVGTITFRKDVFFEGADLQVTERGQEFLVSEARLSMLADGDSNFTNAGQIPFACARIESLFYCLGLFSNNSTTNFIFPALNNGESQGAFEFCQNSVSTEVCISNLANTPDGIVAIRNFTTNPVQAHDSIEQQIKQSSAGAPSDILAYLDYEKQGSNHAYADTEFSAKGNVSDILQMRRLLSEVIRGAD